MRKTVCFHGLYLSVILALGQASGAQLNTINYFSVPFGGASMVAGPDGALRVAAGAYIGQITLTGISNQYAIPNSSIANAEIGITAASDGNIWFTTQSNGTTMLEILDNVR